MSVSGDNDGDLDGSLDNARSDAEHVTDATPDSEKETKEIPPLEVAIAEAAGEGESPPHRDAGDMVGKWYKELREIAAAQLRRETPSHTLQPTALVHEAFLRLANQRSLKEKSRSEMLAIGAHLMRRVLVDHARKRKATKRGGGQDRVLLCDEVSLTVSPQNPVDIAMMDDLIDTLSKTSDRAARVVELRFFGGLTTDEVAEALQVSSRTVDNDWKFAKAWIRRQVSGEA